MPAPRIWATQPFKAVYITYFIAKLPFRIALLVFLHVVKGNPLPGRNLLRHIAAALTRDFFDLCETARVPLIAYSDPRQAKERCVIVEPAAASVYTGVISPSDVIKPEPRPLVWLDGPPPTSPEDLAQLKEQKVVLHYVGGAFVLGLGYNAYGDDVLNTMTKYLKADRVLWSDYRISNESPENKFPAAIQDAITHYAYVVSLGVDPKNIILTGDSAGGNIVLAVLRYLESLQKHQKPALPLPGGAIAFSPWVSVEHTSHEAFYKIANSAFDTVSSTLGQWGSDSYRPTGVISKEVEGYIVPMHHPFKTSVPLFIQDGDAEALYNNINKFAMGMKKVNDAKHFRYHSTPLAPHDILLAHALYGMTEQLGAAVSEAREFFDAAK